TITSPFALTLAPRLAITIDLRSGPAGLAGTWSAPSMRALGIPLAGIRADGPTVHFELVGDESTTVFDGQLRNDSLVGRFEGGEGQGTFALVRRPVPAPAYREEDVRFTNGDVTLAGTLLVPVAAGRHPAVAFVHGSGPEGRFGSRFLADHLARHGVAALIFDKRGVGASTGDWRRATLEDLAGDALAGVRLLRGRRDIDSTSVGIYGHSQGGFVAPIAATRSRDVAFLIAGASYGGPAYEQDLYRVEVALKASELSATDQGLAMAFYKRFVEAARTGRDIDVLERAGDSVRAAAWYQWLEIPPRDHWLWTFYPPVGTFDPLPVWARVRVPVLLIYGQEDRLLPGDLSIRRIGRALDSAGNDRWGAVILPRAAHNFTVSPRPGEPFEWRQVARGLPELVLGWVMVQAGGR
ncbi:MAG: alpha/beta hydrolase family protein, partial [Acidimicrobiales bacterium]